MFSKRVILKATPLGGQSQLTQTNYIFGRFFTPIISKQSVNKTCYHDTQSDNYEEVNLIHIN